MQLKRLLECGLLGAAVTLAACTSEQATSPLSNTAPSTMQIPGGPTCADSVTAYANLLFPQGNNLGTFLQAYNLAQHDYVRATTPAQKAAAQAEMLNAEQFAINVYQAGGLIG